MERPTIAMGEKYECSMCGGTFITDRSNDEAVAEAKARFGRAEKEHTKVVCDDCYQRVVVQGGKLPA
jgi:DNA-directed RNA polymerase subunit RPC12/RpoP